MNRLVGFVRKLLKEFLFATHSDHVVFTRKDLCHGTADLAVCAHHGNSLGLEIKPFAHHVDPVKT